LKASRPDRVHHEITDLHVERHRALAPQPPTLETLKRILPADHLWPIDDVWKQAIAGARSEDAVKLDVFNDIVPLPGTGGYGTVLRSLRTAFMEEWSAKREQARREREGLQKEFQARTKAGKRHEILLTAGQTAGGIREVLSVAEIIRQLVAETEKALARRSVLASR